MAYQLKYFNISYTKKLRFHCKISHFLGIKTFNFTGKIDTAPLWPTNQSLITRLGQNT